MMIRRRVGDVAAYSHIKPSRNFVADGCLKMPFAAALIRFDESLFAHTKKHQNAEDFKMLLN